MKKQVMMVTLFVLVAILFTGFAFAAQTCPDGQHELIGKCGETVACAKCGALVKIEHVFEDFEITCNPTCTEGGAKTAKCSRPGCTAECVKSIRALGHEFVNFVSNGNGTETATCAHDGCHVTHTRKH